MAGPIQLGDVINISRLCWEVYKFGWDNDFNASSQYAEFGRDVRGLAENLDILGRVVTQADQSLRREVALSRALRWDPNSLDSILGDYQSTLAECADLLEKNNRYRLSSGPLKNIEWNVLVAPAADRLRAKIVLHNSKVLHVLKPFEIDLLCRIREDIHKVHQSIQAVHGDLHLLIGILVPDLDQTLAQQAERELHTREIPPTVADGLQRAWSDRPEDDPGPSLQEMADAFVLHFHRSTVNFTPVGILVENRIPRLEQYIELLKCIWLMQHIRDSPQLSQCVPGISHWPSYIQGLEDDLSTQCGRLKQDLIAPSLASLTPDMLQVWPERELPQLVDVVTKDALMEQVLDVPLQSSAANVQRKLQLLRRMGADGKRFRINISGVEQGASTAARRQAETIDFDLKTVVLNPLYAVPSNSGIFDVIICKDERIAKLAFTRFKDVVKFQQAVTGFKALQNYSQYNAMVSFVISGRSEPLVERACVQLWMPKALPGELVTNNEALVEQNAFARSPSATSSAYDSTSRQGTLRSVWNSPEPFTRSPTETVSMWNPPLSIPRRPVGSGSTQATSASAGGGSRQATMPLSPSPSPSSPRSSGLFPGPQQSSFAKEASIATVNSRPDRTFSISSNVSTTTPPSNASSSGSNAQTATVSIGGHATGIVHRRPPKPMLVLFVQNPQTSRLALVTVDVDEDTEVNPDRCNCRYMGREGSSCTIAAVEQKRGTMNLSARRFESGSGSGSGDADWNLARLALGRRGEKEYGGAGWKDVRRISVLFPDAQSRATFGGTPNVCQCGRRTESELAGCLGRMHKGYLGLLRESGRQQLNEYHKAKYGSRQDVVQGMSDDYQ